MLIELVISYFVFAYILIIGTLQIIASYRGLVGLSFFPRGKGLWGYLLGASLAGGASLWFFTSKWEKIFIPGPGGGPGLGGGELSLLFAFAFLTVLSTTLLLAMLLQLSREHSGHHRDLNPDREITGQEVILGPARGRLYLPENPPASKPAICAIPGPLKEDREALGAIARTLVSHDFVCLVLEPYDGDFLPYPDAAALLAMAIGHLSKRQEVDGDHIGVLGTDIGADLAIRAASSDPQIRAVVALAPLLDEKSAQAGLNILQELTLPQAIRWARLKGRKEFLAEVETVKALKKLGSRSLMLIYGSEEHMVPSRVMEQALQDTGPGCRMERVRGEGHHTLFHNPTIAPLLTAWFQERL